MLPTGGGKTVIFARLIASAVEKGNSAVVVAPRIELLTQAKEKLLDAGVPRVGIIGGGHPRTNAPVQVASIQTLCEAKDLHPWDVDRLTLSEFEAYISGADQLIREMKGG